jgi:hypothetical protein
LGIDSGARPHLTFIHGVNYPWSTDGQTIFYGLDFGANVWGSHLGVSTRRDAIARDFDDMAHLGFVVARWFVFCDGRAGIAYDDRSLPAGLDEQFFADLDAGLEIARDANIRVDLVLFDHHWLFRGIRDTLADPVTGDLLEARLPEGRAWILSSQEGHDALFEHVIAPLIRRYSIGGQRADLRDQIFAFEFMNEPDFVVDEWERDRSPQVARALPFAALAAAFARLSELVHNHSPAIVTLGGARADNLWAWDADALGLDVIGLHAYPDTPHPGDVDVFSTPARALDVRRDVILGEFRASAPLDECLEKALAGGYIGAWPWSFSGTDRYGRLPVDALRRFGERHPELVNPRFSPS